MHNLPEEFTEYTRDLFGEEKWQMFVDSFCETRPVSVRLNPHKPTMPEILQEAVPVDWCRNAYYLKERPDFTLDPLIHAGCYYVQEAGSMFLDEVMRQLVEQGFDAGDAALDLCAAPGGKSSLLRGILPDTCRLYSNEPDRRRANILMENLQKQGHPKVTVTNGYAKDYQKAKLKFNLIVTDVPCSGEGMFRKDEGAISEWSISNVMKCQQLQKSIIEDIWPCLNEGGILIYSTCTFNTRENEENIRWICDELGAEIVTIQTKPEWKVTGALLSGFDGSVYRFIPGVTKTEGLFICVLRKTADDVVSGKENMRALRVLCDGVYPGTQKGKSLIPDHAEALLTNFEEGKYPEAEVDRETALRYLRREAIVLDASAPIGYVIITHQNQRLGFVKNLGNRANNLYPQEWKIRKEI